MAMSRRSSGGWLPPGFHWAIHLNHLLCLQCNPPIHLHHILSFPSPCSWSALHCIRLGTKDLVLAKTTVFYWMVCPPRFASAIQPPSSNKRCVIPKDIRYWLCAWGSNNKTWTTHSDPPPQWSCSPLLQVAPNPPCRWRLMKVAHMPDATLTY